MRRFVLAALAMILTVGLSVASEVTFVKYDADKRALTVKEEDGKEATYTVTDATTVSRGDKTPKLENVLKNFAEKTKPGAKFDITVNKEKKTVTAIKLPAKGS